MKAPSTRLKIFVATAVVVVLAGVILAVRHHNGPTNTTYLPKASSSVAPSSSPVSNDSAPTITPNSSPQTDASGLVTVTTPLTGDTITSGSKVAGTVQLNASRLYFRLKGGKSGQLASGNVTIQPNPTAPQAFNFELDFTNQVSGGSDQGVLQVYTLDAGGAETDVANVNVNIQG